MRPIYRELRSPANSVTETGCGPGIACYPCVAYACPGGNHREASPSGAAGLLVIGGVWLRATVSRRVRGRPMRVPVVDRRAALQLTRFGWPPSRASGAHRQGNGHLLCLKGVVAIPVQTGADSTHMDLARTSCRSLSSWGRSCQAGDCDFVADRIGHVEEIIAAAVNEYAANLERLAALCSAVRAEVNA